MRLRGHTELWQELAQAHWLHLPDLKSAPVKVQLRDVTLLDHTPGRRTRCHAAHWALHPAPLAVPATAPPAVRLTALVLAAHTSAHDRRGVDLDVLARLCGHSPQQTGELLDRLVAGRTLSAWHHQRDTDEVHWQPASHDLAREHLASQNEPRSAAEIATALGQQHPKRTIKTTVVRTTLEGLVAKSQAQRTKQGPSVFYTAADATQPAPAETESQPEPANP